MHGAYARIACTRPVVYNVYRYIVPGKRYFLFFLLKTDVIIQYNAIQHNAVRVVNMQ